jgi:hypothetical protein
MPFHLKQGYLRRISAEIAGFMDDPLSVLSDAQRAQAPVEQQPTA